MGIIKRQGIKQSVVAYIGAIIGLVNILIIYPFAWTPEELGLVRFIIDSAILFHPFVLLGLTQVAIKYFPNFEDKERKHNGFLFFLLLGVGVSFILFYSLYLLFQEQVLVFYSNKSPLFQKYIPYILPLTGIISFGSILTAYCTSLKRIAIPSIFNLLYIKIALPSLALAYFFDFISMNFVVWGVLGSYTLRLLSYLVYVKKLGELHLKPDFRQFDKGIVKEMGVYAGYSILGGVSAILATQIDTVMVASISKGQLESAGIYSIAMYMANVILIPARAIWMISSPIIANAWKNENVKEIQNIYTKASINVLVIGVLLLVGIWSCIDDLFLVIPNGDKFISGKYVVLILGMGQLFNVATSVNNQILMYSKYFRFHFLTLVFLAVFNIICNMIFIPKFEMIGAALATLCSLFLFNLIKLAFIKYKMKMQPFSWKTLQLLLIGISVYVIAYFLPMTSNPLINILIKAVVISSLYGIAVLAFNISPDINKIPKQILNRLKK